MTAVARAVRDDPAGQAFCLLRIAFTAAPIAFGLTSSSTVMVDWPVYLAPWIDELAPGSAHNFVLVVGAVEVLAGLLVAAAPSYGGYLVAAWVGVIIINLLSHSGYYDIAGRDFGLMLGALTLARLGVPHNRPRRG